MKDGNCLAVCESIHDVIALETALKAANRWCEMVPTPRAVSSDCGMSIEFSCMDRADLLDITAGNQICLAAVFSFSTGRFVEQPIDS